MNRLKCIASSDAYLVGRVMSRESLAADGYRCKYIKGRMVYLFMRGNTYIELSQYTFEETMNFLEQGN